MHINSFMRMWLCSYRQSFRTNHRPCSCRYRTSWPRRPGFHPRRFSSQTKSKGRVCFQTGPSWQRRWRRFSVEFRWRSRWKFFLFSRDGKSCLCKRAQCIWWKRRCRHLRLRFSSLAWLGRWSVPCPLAGLFKDRILLKVQSTIFLKLLRIEKTYLRNFCLGKLLRSSHICIGLGNRSGSHRKMWSEDLHLRCCWKMNNYFDLERVSK